MAMGPQCYKDKEDMYPEGPWCKREGLDYVLQDMQVAESK